MTAMPIRAVVAPSTITASMNGAVPAYLLEQVDGRTGYTWLLVSQPARGMRALHAAVRVKFGVQLSSVGRGRTYEQQRSEFIVRHTNVTLAVYNATAKKSGVANKRIWMEGVTKYGYATPYWILKAGYASAAVPGTSPHGLNLADDVCLPGNVAITARPDILEWLYANAHLYGFAWSLTSEPWHMQWISGDTIPAAVLLFEKGNPAPTPNPPPTPPTNPKDDMSLTIFACADAGAKFIAYTAPAPIGGNAIALSCSWLRTEARYNAFKGFGVPEVTVTAADLKNVDLIGPVPSGDWYAWTKNNFASVSVQS